MKAEIIRFLNSIEERKLVTICDEISHNSWNGYSEKCDLINHIIAHYDIYDCYSKNSVLPENVKIKCVKHKELIDRIINRHRSAMTLIDRNKLQCRLMADSRLECVEWVLLYAKRFQDVFDDEGYRDYETIKKLLYK